MKFRMIRFFECILDFAKLMPEVVVWKLNLDRRVGFDELEMNNVGGKKFDLRTLEIPSFIDNLKTNGTYHQMKVRSRIYSAT